ncbi:hypothetical protein BDM02DRAFT_3130191 [Thelephora ganbajun]|uniref:Uncharacterized protein n=1 Tax=Thelephora ganbajun TaxID=370292 RepID=A0ACB6ZB58_THEGA|nr:hypothetical protein BDM02DRAFT_3130191 [Thelephora ganbajun]
MQVGVNTKKWWKCEKVFSGHGEMTTTIYAVQHYPRSEWRYENTCFWDVQSVMEEIDSSKDAGSSTSAGTRLFNSSTVGFGSEVEAEARWNESLMREGGSSRISVRVFNPYNQTPVLLDAITVKWKPPAGSKLDVVGEKDMGRRTPRDRVFYTNPWWPPLCEGATIPCTKVAKQKGAF